MTRGLTRPAPVADIQSLKTIYRRLAKIEAGAALADQKAWLESKFVAHAGAVDEGDAVATAIGKLGSNSAWLWRGATAQERAEALNAALADIEAEIENDEGSAVTAPAPLIMRFGEAPFTTLDQQT